MEGGAAMALCRLLVFLTAPLCCASLPAAGPVLQERPFVVVWNMPTANCQRRHAVQLDLERYGILENKRQRFQGQKMTIFYRDRLGTYPYLSRDGRTVNGGLPQRADLAAHLALAETQLSVPLRPNFSGLAVIDWEEWQPVWASNFGSKMKYRRLSKRLVRRERPDLTETAVRSLAKRAFEEGARRFLEETLRLAVRRRPKGFWGFYGFPFCFNKNKRKTDQSYTGRCHKGTRQQNDQLSWLWAQSTALYPSIYLPPGLAGSEDAALMVRHRLLEALRVASLYRHGNSTTHATPVLPYARLAFTHTLNFLNKTDLEHTLGEAASLGAAGVVLWGELKFAKSKKQCLLLRDYVRSVLGPFVQSLRSDAQRCSRQLCHGNGRCTRRRPGSGRRLASTSDPREIPEPAGRGYFRKHFACLCYPGRSGQGCQGQTDGSRQRDD